MLSLGMKLESTLLLQDESLRLGENLDSLQACDLSLLVEMEVREQVQVHREWN